MVTTNWLCSFHKNCTSLECPHLWPHHPRPIKEVELQSGKLIWLSCNLAHYCERYGKNVLCDICH